MHLKTFFFLERIQRIHLTDKVVLATRNVRIFGLQGVAIKVEARRR